MSKFSKAFKKNSNVVKALVNPVGAGIKKLTGISQGNQLKMGAGIGAGVGLYGLGKGVQGAAQNAGPGGIPLSSAVNGGELSRSSNGPMSGFNPWSMLSPVLGAGADIWSANKVASGQEEANATNLESAREQMAFQASQTAQQQSFQSEMSNTAHQREVADLKAAGLNPVLSANSGASTPAGASGSGAQASVQNAAPNYGGIVPKGIDTAVRLKQMQKDFESTDSGIYLNAAAADREESNAKVARNSAKKVAQDTRISKAEADLAEMRSSYARKHPKLFRFGEGMKYISPAVDTAVGVGEAYTGARRDIAISKGRWWRK